MLANIVIFHKIIDFFEYMCYNLHNIKVLMGAFIAHYQGVFRLIPLVDCIIHWYFHEGNR